MFCNKILHLNAVLTVLLVYCFDSSTFVIGTWGKSQYPKKVCEGEQCHQKCYPTPHAMEGPFYVPGKPFRKDIREGKEGVPLQLELNIQDYHSNCKPATNAEVHVWQPDAEGVYSSYLAYYPLGKPGSKQITGEHAEPSDFSTFLRGIQNTDAQGKATFMTIYPGWYLHRSLHIHFKVFISKEEIYTGEVYFPENISDQVAKVKPYSGITQERAKNEEDWLFVRLDGFKSIANITGDVKHGFTASLNVIVELPMTEDEL